MQDLLQFPKVVILTCYDMEKGEVETYFVLIFMYNYTWEKVSCCSVYTYHEQLYSQI